MRKIVLTMCGLRERGWDFFVEYSFRCGSDYLRQESYLKATGVVVPFPTSHAASTINIVAKLVFRVWLRTTFSTRDSLSRKNTWKCFMIDFGAKLSGGHTRRY